MINLNLTLNPSSIDEAIEWAKKWRDAGLPIAPMQTPVSLGQSIDRSDEEDDLREVYRNKFGKGFRLTKEQKAANMHPIECMKAALGMADLNGAAVPSDVSQSSTDNHSFGDKDAF